MSRRVLVAGHWTGGEPAAPTALAALGAVAEGFVEQAPHWQARIRPFGAGAAFAEALEGAREDSYRPILVPFDAASTLDAGRAAREALDAGLVPVVEGGHCDEVDCGLGFLQGLTGLDLSERAELEAALPEALRIGRDLLAGRDLVAAASTRRPLLGLASVLAVGVDLEARTTQDRALTSLLARALAEGRRPSLPLAGSGAAPAPGREPGSGAAGGAAAVIAAIGGRIFETGPFLRAATGLDAELEDCDLVIVLEPRLHSPSLSDRALDAITGAAAERALPVVALGVESSLSAPERAEWGLHGQFETLGSVGLKAAGARIARTWAA